MKRTGAVVALLVVGAALPVSCAKKPSVNLVLLDPCLKDANYSFQQQATYTEITVFKNGCPPDADLALGLSTLGNTDLTANPEMKRFLPAAYDGVAAKGDPLPTVGDLDKKKYGFAAIMRDANCGVIGFGCTEANMQNIREVRVAVRAWSQTDQSKICEPLKGKGCLTGRSCEQGRCLLPSDGGEGGTGCSLSVFASGPLSPLSSGEAGTARFSGPTVAASTAGFVVGYRTQESGTLYAHAALLTPSGALNSPSTIPLMACAGQSPADGVGLAFSGGNGLMALALPDCDNNGAGAYFMAVDPNAQLSALKLARTKGQFQDLTLAPTHALSGTDAPNIYDFVYRATFPPPSSNIQMQLAQLQGNSFGGGVSSLFCGDAAIFGQVASTSQIQALLGQVPSQAAVELRVGAPGAGITSCSGDGGSAYSFTLPLAGWGALTAWDDRAAAIAPGPGSGLTLQAATAAGEDLGKITLEGDQFASGDIVALRDHLIVVGAEGGHFTLYRIDGATGGVTPVPEGGPPPQDSGAVDSGAMDSGAMSEGGQPEGGQPEGGPTDSGPPPPQDSGSGSGSLTMAAKTTIDISSLKLPKGATFDGNQISIAALGSEVAVVWRSKFNPDPSAPGGWALLKCAK